MATATRWVWARWLVALAMPAALSGCATDGTGWGSIKEIYRVGGEGEWAPNQQPYEVGKRHFKAGRYGLALSAFEQALSVNRGSVDALNGIGACYDRLGRFRTAQTYYHRALEADPRSARTLNNLGFSLMLEGRLDEARQVLRLSRKYDRDNPYSRHNLDYLARLDERDGAAPASAPSRGRADRRVDVTENVDGAAMGEQIGRNQSQATMPVGSGSPPEPGRASKGGTHLAESFAREPTSDSIVREPEAKHRMQDNEPPTAAAPQSQGSRDAQPQVLPERTPSTADEPSGRSEPSVTRGPEENGPRSVVIENGNGWPGLATAVGDFLEQRGYGVADIGNARPFDKRRTRIEYADGDRNAAQRIGTMFPITPILREHSGREQQLRIVLGRDMVFFAPLLERTIRNDAKRYAMSRHTDRASNATLWKAIDGVEVEVANGNGRRGMASLTAKVLDHAGTAVGGISNADSFSYERTTIYYQAKEASSARVLARNLPVDPSLVEKTIEPVRNGIRLILGRDLLPFEASMRRIVGADA